MLPSGQFPDAEQDASIGSCEGAVRSAQAVVVYAKVRASIASTDDFFIVISSISGFYELGKLLGQRTEELVCSATPSPRALLEKQ